MSKWLLRLLKLYKLSRFRMALNCSCVFSLLIFGVRPLFPYWCRGLTFGATFKAILQCFWASWVCLYYPVFHVLMLPNAWLLCVYLMLQVVMMWVVRKVLLTNLDNKRSGMHNPIIKNQYVCLLVDSARSEVVINHRSYVKVKKKKKQIKTISVTGVEGL
jgi:hypothetical protein